MEESASATVATREEVCLRPKFLRFACILNHNRIIFADTRESAMVTTAIRHTVGDSIMVSVISDDTVTATPMSTASIFVLIMLTGWIGPVPKFGCIFTGDRKPG